MPAKSGFFAVTPAGIEPCGDLPVREPAADYYPRSKSSYRINARVVLGIKGEDDRPPAEVESFTRSPESVVSSMSGAGLPSSTISVPR